ADSAAQETVRAAARFLREHRDLFPEAGVATDATQFAVLAIEIHGLFLGEDDPDPDVVRAEVLRRVQRQSGGCS
ncbi:MAG: hypothetical protein M3144_08930, partial [Actinomycetota bacterium]|nr:hypothetical protein [Actinomycetota bacterium]